MYYECCCELERFRYFLHLNAENMFFTRAYLCAYQSPFWKKNVGVFWVGTEKFNWFFKIRLSITCVWSYSTLFRSNSFWTLRNNNIIFISGYLLVVRFPLICMHRTGLYYSELTEHSAKIKQCKVIFGGARNTDLTSTSFIILVLLPLYWFLEEPPNYCIYVFLMRSWISQ